MNMRDYSTGPVNGVDLTETEAAARLDESGGYMVRTGFAGRWMVVDAVADVDGFRDFDAYGVDLRDVTEVEWEAAEWREDRLPGYDG